MNRKLIHRFRRLYIPIVKWMGLLENSINGIIDLYNNGDNYTGLRELSIGKEDKICLLVPHVDDEILGMGGTLHQLIDKDIETLIIYTSDGRKSFLSDVDEETMIILRNEEAYRWTKEYTNITIKTLNYNSMEWNPQEKSEEVLGIINSFKPNKIFFPGICDKNEDHVKNAICLSLIVNRIISSVKLFMFPVQTPILTSLLTDYTALDAQDIVFKEKTLTTFVSQSAMQKSFDKVVFYNKLIAKGYHVNAIEVFAELSDIEVGELKSRSIKRYYRSYPSITYKARLGKVIKTNDIMQNDVFL